MPSELHCVFAVGVREVEDLSCVLELELAVRVCVGWRAEPGGLSGVAGGVDPYDAVRDGGGEDVEGAVVEGGGAVSVAVELPAE